MEPTVGVQRRPAIPPVRCRVWTRSLVMPQVLCSPTIADVKTTRSTRADRAAQTRLRMVRAAYDLFTERGYQASTMGDIAERAAVAVQTLHFTFGTKAVLLQNTYDYAVIGEGEQVPPDEQPW